MRSYPKICLENINPEELEALTAQLDGDEVDLDAQKDDLEDKGTISKDQAEEIKDDLPEDIALESFTQFPTKTNYAVALESINLGLAIVAVAGLAALGAGIIMVMRMINNKGGSSLSAEAKKTYASALKKSLSEQSEDMRKEAFTRIVGSNINELVYTLLFGRRERVTGFLGSMTDMNTDSVKKLIEEYAVKDLEYLAQHPDTTEINKLPSNGKGPDKGIKNLFIFIDMDLGSTRNPDEVRTPAAFKHAFSEKYLAKASVTKGDEHDFVVNSEVTEFSYNEMAKVEKISGDIREFAKRNVSKVESSVEKLDSLPGLDKGVVDYVRQNLRDIRGLLDYFDLYTWVGDHLIDSANRASKIKNALLAHLEDAAAKKPE